MIIRQQTCSWLWSCSLWPCLRATGTRLSLLVEHLISPYKLAYKKDKKDIKVKIYGAYRCTRKHGRQLCVVTSPYVRDSLFVFIVCGPYCYFIPFSTDINDCSTHVVAGVVESFAHEAQKLQEKHSCLIYKCFSFLK